MDCALCGPLVLLLTDFECMFTGPGALREVFLCPPDSFRSRGWEAFLSGQGCRQLSSLLPCEEDRGAALQNWGPWGLATSTPSHFPCGAPPRGTETSRNHRLGI